MRCERLLRSGILLTTLACSNGNASGPNDDGTAGTPGSVTALIDGQQFTDANAGASFNQGNLYVVARQTAAGMTRTLTFRVCLVTAPGTYALMSHRVNSASFAEEAGGVTALWVHHSPVRGNGSGQVVVTRLDNRIAGSFSFTLHPNKTFEDGTPSKVISQGQFNLAPTADGINCGPA